MIERTIETTTHGRYLVSAKQMGLPLLAGFHGYGESAEDEFERLRSIEGSDRWITVAIQGLHRFYRRRTDEIVASWMTRQDRLLAIADNIKYTAGVIDSVCREFSPAPTIVLSGFSQGVAMAYRCAASSTRPVRGLISLGGDIPPELDSTTLSRIPSVLIGRGIRDEWYTEVKARTDEQRLRASNVDVKVMTIDAGHEWSPEFALAASRFLESIRIG
jgi:predicted esterase